MKNLINTKEVEKDLKYLNPFDWELHCGACDHFGTDECPYRGAATPETYYEEEFNCKNFWD